MGTKFNELTIGDVVQQRRSNICYTVAGFNEHPAGPNAGEVHVFLTRKDGKPEHGLNRTLSQLVKNWLKVSEAS